MVNQTKTEQVVEDWLISKEELLNTIYSHFTNLLKFLRSLI